MSDSYHTCQDRCNVCENCNATCNTKQNFCSISSQTASVALNFDNPWATVKKNEPIITALPRNKYNSILTYIKKAYDYGKVNSGLSMTVEPETGDFITAKKTNEIMDAINKLNGQVISNSVPYPLQKDVHIVYASYFQEIAQGLMKMQLREIQCNDCNTECNVTCNTCNSCNSCITCNNCNSVTSWSCSQWSCSQWSDSGGA